MNQIRTNPFATTKTYSSTYVHDPTSNQYFPRSSNSARLAHPKPTFLIQEKNSYSSPDLMSSPFHRYDSFSEPYKSKPMDRGFKQNPFLRGHLLENSDYISSNARLYSSDFQSQSPRYAPYVHTNMEANDMEQSRVQRFDHNNFKKKKSSHQQSARQAQKEDKSNINRGLETIGKYFQEKPKAEDFNHQNLNREYDIQGRSMNNPERPQEKQKEIENMSKYLKEMEKNEEVQRKQKDFNRGKQVLGKYLAERYTPLQETYAEDPLMAQSPSRILKKGKKESSNFDKPKQTVTKYYDQRDRQRPKEIESQIKKVEKIFDSDGNDDYFEKGSPSFSKGQFFKKTKSEEEESPRDKVQKKDMAKKEIYTANGDLVQPQQNESPSFPKWKRVDSLEERGESKVPEEISLKNRKFYRVDLEGESNYRY